MLAGARASSALCWRARAALRARQQRQEAASSGSSGKQASEARGEGAKRARARAGAGRAARGKRARWRSAARQGARITFANDNNGIGPVSHSRVTVLSPSRYWPISHWPFSNRVIAVRMPPMPSPPAAITRCYRCRFQPPAVLARILIDYRFFASRRYRANNIFVTPGQLYWPPGYAGLPTAAIFDTPFHHVSHFH